MSTSVEMSLVIVTGRSGALVGTTITALLWSIARPDRRIWPPQSYGRWTPVLVWVPTFVLIGVIVGLGLSTLPTQTLADTEPLSEFVMRINI